MTGLDPLSRAFLSATAGCHEPTSDDHHRIRYRLATRLGVVAGIGILGSTATQTSSAIAATTTGAIAESSLAGTLLGSAKLFTIGKVVGVTLAASAAGVGGYQWAAAHNTPPVHLAPAASAPLAGATHTERRVVAHAISDSAAVSSAKLPPSQLEVKAAASSEETLRNRTSERVAGNMDLGVSQEPNLPSPASATLPPVAAFPPVAANLAAEARGLAHAQAALREGNAANALTLLEQQQAQFSGGSLEEEREAARVLALCKMGRFQAANAAAAEFLRKSPRSVLAERVANACSTHK